MKAVFFGLFFILVIASASALLTSDGQVLSAFDKGELTGKVIILLIGLIGMFYSGRKLLRNS